MLNTTLTHQVPLVLEERVGGICLGREVNQVLDLQGVVPSLVVPKKREQSSLANYVRNNSTRYQRGFPIH